MLSANQAVTVFKLWAELTSPYHRQLLTAYPVNHLLQPAARYPKPRSMDYLIQARTKSKVKKLIYSSRVLRSGLMYAWVGTSFAYARPLPMRGW